MILVPLESSQLGLPDGILTRALGHMSHFVTHTDVWISQQSLHGKTRSNSFLEGRKVGVIAGTSHEAYLKAMFTDAELHSYPNDEALRIALRRGEVDFVFGDAISLAFWINGTDSGDCCAFSGGPFVESRYFGEGVGIAVRKGNDLLRQALNYALFRLWEKGRYTDLWLRYFSVSPF